MNTATKPAASPTDQQQLVAFRAAAEADLAAYRLEQFARLDAIPGELIARIGRAERGNPSKARKRAAEARVWAEASTTAILQAITDREAEHIVSLRSKELAVLERLRGNDVIRDIRDIDTPVIKDGAPLFRDGVAVTKREHIDRPKITNRDGLETLSRSHLTASGEPKVRSDGSPPLPAINEFQYRAGMAYRAAYEAADPERSLKAVNIGAVTGGGGAADPFGRRALSVLARRMDAANTLEALDLHVRAAAGADGVLITRAVAGLGMTVHSIAPSGRRNRRMTEALDLSLSALAERMGLW